MGNRKLYDILDKLLAQYRESEWVEFKLNYHSDAEIGERISALANAACLRNHPYGYLVFGVADGTFEIKGTSFKPHQAKVGNEELEHWLVQMLNPKIDFRIHELEYDKKQIVIFEIPASKNQPVAFQHKAYIRIGSITRPLSAFPEKERKIWRSEPDKAFEEDVALSGVSAAEIVSLLDTQSYFDLLKLPYPTTRTGVIERFGKEKLIIYREGVFDITNLGGILFAKELSNFPTLSRKALRVSVYSDKSRINTLRDVTGNKGYAVGFEGLINYINAILPSNEEIKKALRETIKVYPEIAIREILANALIHQDFYEKGTGPIVEIFSDRIETSNPGLPLITPTRFIDDYVSRNEMLASFMRRLRICEERGTGIDKVIKSVEEYQLPAPEFIVQERHTKVVLYAPMLFNDMEKRDRIRACYQHCCLRYLANEKMTNQSLRDRFMIEEHNASIASRIISDTLDNDLIKKEDPDSKSRKFPKYIPFWA